MLQNVTKFKTGGKDRWWMLPSFAGMALLLLLFLALVPLPVLSAHAEGDNGATTFSAWLSPSVTLTMADSVSEDIEPTVSGTFKNLATVAHVEVNNSDYYEVSLHASSKDMVSPSTTNDPQAKISSITAAQNQASFSPNQWGYNLTKNPTGVTTAAPTTTDTEYQPIATTATAMPGIGKQATTNNAASDYYTLNFGAKVDTSIPAGLYSSTVTLSVVASPKQVYGFDRTDTMQGMTADICKEIGTDADLTNGGATKYAATDSLGNTYYTKRLKDLRDGKLYWVAKLKDGNCWMTQNLALDITEAGLTPELTDITEPWNSQSEYPPVETNMVDFTYLDSTTNSFNQGLWVPTTVQDYITCTNQTSVANCAENSAHFVNVKDWVASNDPLFAVKNNNNATDADNHIYDAHYLIGNWYSWNAATAGTGQDTDDGRNAPGSICPKNWRLPQSQFSADFSGVNQYTLLKSYGFDFVERGDYKYPAEFNNFVTSLPLAFVRSGRINGRLIDFDHNGYYWIATTLLKSSLSAYGFSFYGTSLSTPASYNQYNALVVRCIMTTE